ncbi:MAG: hypothetical protein K2M69_05945, partial [Muribaculaceae bacterium]|nr:hypothetical protein [Muribaculaceae bacterium]
TLHHLNQITTNIVILTENNNNQIIEKEEMEEMKTYAYTAKNRKTYLDIAMTAAELGLKASLHPKQLTVVVEETEETKKAHDDLRKRIIQQGWEVETLLLVAHDECRAELIDNPLTPSSMLREMLLAEKKEKLTILDDFNMTSAKLEKTQSSYDYYLSQYCKSEAKLTELKNMMKAYSKMLEFMSELDA